MPASPKYYELLRVLTAHGVRYIVVGGVAAILEGAPIATFDLDVVYDWDLENCKRLQAALESIGARYRDPAGRRILPTLDRLSTLRLSLLQTDLGPLDVIALLDEDQGFQELLDSTEVRQVVDLDVRVLRLAKLIELKERANREKDRAVLPVLRRTLELQD